MAIYIATGEGNSHGDAVTISNLGAAAMTGGFNATYNDADVMPGTPTGWIGFRFSPGGTKFVRFDDTATTSDRFAVSFPFYVSGTPAAHLNLSRITTATESTLTNAFLRSNRAVRAYDGGSSISASESPVLSLGWHVIELLTDNTEGGIGVRVYADDWTIEHEWYGTGYVFSGAPALARVGEPAASAHGIDPIRIGAGIRYGTLATSEWLDPTGPPPDTTAVSHYNTAEGLAVDTLIPLGGGVGPEGSRMDARLGSGGTVTVTDQAPIFGDRSYRVESPAGDSGYATWTVSSRKCAVRVYMDIPATPSETTRVLILRNTADEPIGCLFLSQDGRIGLQVENNGTAETQYLTGGVVSYPAAVRLELRVDVAANLVEGGWGYKGSERVGAMQITTRDLGGFDLVVAQFGKCHGTAWAADFLMDELAANIYADDLVGAQSDNYTLLPTVGGNLTDLEPGAEFIIEAQGVGSWSQTMLSGHPVVPLTLSDGGTVASGEAPYTLAGLTLEFTYGDIPLTVGVLPATERFVMPDGTEVPMRRVLVDA